MPAISLTPASAPADGPQVRGLGGGLRGRILVIEGGYGGGRRPWGRGGSAHGPVLSTLLAGVAPQVLLAADAVDAVHLPGAADPQSVLAHLRAAARHPGPLLIHLGGHLVTDRRGGQFCLTLREGKAAESLPWSAIATELRHRSAELDTLVIADLSAEHTAWPQLTSAVHVLSDGVPLWATVSPDPDQLGTFTRALIEALHRGRPGADAVLTPEELRQQVHSVLRPDTLVLTTHAADRPYFRNTSRQIGPAALAETAQASAMPAQRAAQAAPAAPADAAAPARPRLSPSWSPRGMVSLRKPGVPPTPPRPARPVSLEKRTTGHPDTEPADGTAERAAGPRVELGKAAGGADVRVKLGKGDSGGSGAGDAVDAGDVRVEFGKPAAPGELPAGAGQSARAGEPPVAPEASGEPRVELGKGAPAAQPPVDYREAIGRIVRTAEAGEHDAAAELALALEQQTAAAHGSVAPAALQARQVRAHVSRLAGRPELAAELYREVAFTLLRTEGGEHPETQQAATNAEACWRAIPDPSEAIRMAPEIIELRAHLPGEDGRKLRAAERHLQKLVAAKSANAADSVEAEQSA